MTAWNSWPVACALVVVAAGHQNVSRARGIDDCTPQGDLVRIAEIPEASGAAVSRRIPGQIWSHNDSGKPLLVALDDRGTVTRRIELAELSIDDWEAIAVGPCPGGSCVYVGDIGDNAARRDRITVYRIPEPPADARTAGAADMFHATYPDGPHDAETLLVTTDGTMLIVTKGETGPIAIYRFPQDTRAGATVRLERVGEPREGPVARANRVTDGSVSPDGAWVALRSNEALTFYRTADLLAGTWKEVSRVDLTPLGEPQGEGIALGADNIIYLLGEGGGKMRGGTFARLACAPES